MMQEAVTRFQQTIGHLTDISRLQQEGSAAGEAGSLAAIIADVQLDLAPLLATTGAQVTVAVADAPTLPLSPKNLRSVVYNLLSNALKYRAPDRGPVVHIECQPQGEAAVLRVHDNGLGLDERQQQRLFGLFQRLHAHVEGSGVGLYMVRKIVENAGGTVQVQSQVGVGSTFIVTLPRPPEHLATQIP
ncbi:GHKL domain-containing protein [Hymenobacter sp. BRD128]|uniref:sensor histidine kinase n=1 Tax=Hymenobacter sp. BRD128 TaxID=2675878 RepID=UPI0015630B9D|nr:ATP-binding protein [Hymenobacter sp. BRD128]QKG58447.1 GHKL domain-containing protein [Hymenobacter sp. BRD128]